MKNKYPQAVNILREQPELFGRLDPYQQKIDRSYKYLKKCASDFDCKREKETVEKQRIAQNNTITQSLAIHNLNYENINPPCNCSCYCLLDHNYQRTKLWDSEKLKGFITETTSNLMKNPSLKYNGFWSVQVKDDLTGTIYNQALTKGSVRIWDCDQFIVNFAYTNKRKFLNAINAIAREEHCLQMLDNDQISIYGRFKCKGEGTFENFIGATNTKTFFLTINQLNEMLVSIWFEKHNIEIAIRPLHWEVQLPDYFITKLSDDCLTFSYNNVQSQLIFENSKADMELEKLFKTAVQLYRSNCTLARTARDNPTKQQNCMNKINALQEDLIRSNAKSLTYISIGVDSKPQKLDANSKPTDMEF